MDSIRQFWTDVMAISAARWMVALFGLASVILIGYYVIKWFRDLALGGGSNGLSNISHLSEFERLHSEGKLDADEYQRLKQALPQNIMPEMAATLKQKHAKQETTVERTSDDEK